MKKSVYDMDRAMMKAWLNMLHLERIGKDPEAITAAQQEYKRLNDDLNRRLEADEREMLLHEGETRQAVLAFYND